MWQLVFFCYGEQTLVESYLQCFENVNEAVDLVNELNDRNGCYYELMKASELPLLKGPTLPELIAAGKVPHPHFKMRKSEEPQDGWTDPTVLAQLTERDIA